MNIKKNILLVGAAILASASVASAQTLYNVQFGDSSDLTTTYSGNGAVANPTDSNWNPVFGPETGSALSSGDLVSSTGGSSSITVTTSVVNTHNWTGTGNDSGNALFNGIIFPGGSTFSINNLTAGLTYNLYVYANNGATANAAPGTAISVDGGPAQLVTGVGSTFSAAPATTDFIDGVEYTEFTIVDLVGTTITGTFNDAGNGALNGFQLQAESPSVPEPSTTLSLLFGGIAMGVLLAFRRQRKDLY